jgi:hypothetical protein
MGRRSIKLWEELDKSYQPMMCAVTLPLLLGGVASDRRAHPSIF